MTDPLRRQLGAWGADVLHAKYSKDEIKRINAPGRKAARTKLEADIIACYQLDEDAPDFGDRLQHGISAHYRALRLRRAK